MMTSVRHVTCTSCGGAAMEATLPGGRVVLADPNELDPEVAGAFDYLLAVDEDGDARPFHPGSDERQRGEALHGIHRNRQGAICRRASA